MYIGVLFVGWRLLLFLTAAVAIRFFPHLKFSFPYIEQLVATTMPEWLWTAANFDGVHYLSIAQSFYSAYFTQAFFPIYPLLIRLVLLALPFLNLSWSHGILVGLFISNATFLVALFIFWKLLRMDYNPIISCWTIIFLLTFPTAFFFGALYSESLFLLLAIGAFLLARKRRWFMSALCIGLASGTRVIGILLLPTILYDYLRATHMRGTIRGLTVSLLNSLRFFWIAPAGLVGYIAFQWWQLGHPFFFLHSQTQFGAGRLDSGIVLLPQVLWRYTKILTTVPVTHYDFWVGLWELLFTILGFSLLLFGFKRPIPRSYLLFGLLALLLPTLSGTLSSMPRYLLLVFPIFIVLAHIKSTWVKGGLAGIFLVLELVFMTLFTRGWWVA